MFKTDSVSNCQTLLADTLQTCILPFLRQERRQGVPALYGEGISGRANRPRHRFYVYTWWNEVWKLGMQENVSQSTGLAGKIK